METIGQLIPEALNTLRTTLELPAISTWRPTLDAHHPSLVVAADACAKFIADMARGRSPYWLTICGTLGAGKTMLARQIFDEAKRHNPGDADGPWVTGTGIYDETKRRPGRAWFTANGFKDKMLGGEFDLPEYLRADYLVVIDDMGATRDTRGDALADGLYRLADNRIGRWMVWTTNLDLMQISERFDGRISSRMIRDDNRLVTITAPDYALVRK